MQMALERYRESKGWSRKQLGERVGVTSEAIRLIEAGKREPSYKVLVALEDAFGASHRELLRREE